MTLSRLPLVGRRGAGGLAAGLALLLRALKDPRRFASNTTQLGALADEFVRGGVVVETRGYSTTVQADGDLQLRMFEAFRACPAECQAAALRVHFESLADRLRPLADAAAAMVLARAALNSLAGLNLFAPILYAEVTSIYFWLPQILTVVLAVAARRAPRLIWWLIRRWLRRRMRGVDAGSRGSTAPGAVEP